MDVDGVKYQLVDLESLFIISPRYEKYIASYLAPVANDVFVDAGAHVGKYTFSLARIVGPGGKVVAIEPDPRNFDALKEGIRLNGFSNISAFNVAAFDCERELTLYLAPDEGMTHMGWLFGKGGSSIKRKDNRSVCVVKAQTIDKIVDGLRLSHVDFVKIDVEGAEYEVLIGAKDTIEKFRPRIVIECTENLGAITQLMKKFGYGLTNIGPSYYFLEPIRCP